ncbi:restriction endonuclease subunit S [Corynebacterium sp.]|uniref:restriction endonuclease subunit S n=1 Tax=Corynebacterium sp. TaxID=1720 RepID=UPI0026DC1CB9|nr:restriction endonuclease subunit S [Corynebacterium sp.]MDO5077481.1 restriction endonuclease subunit S [Corynebacterium sp.]
MVKLGEVCEIKYGKALKKEARVPGDVQVFGSSGVIGSHVTPNFDGPVCVIGRKGSAGQVSWSEKSCWVIDTAFAAMPLSDETDSRWLFYMLRTLDLAKLEKHAAVPGISKSDLVQESIPLPPLDEQKRIAKVLGEIAFAIELVSKQIGAVDESLRVGLWNVSEEGESVSLSHYVQKITSGKSLKEGDSDDCRNAVLKISAVTSGYFDEAETKPLPNSYIPSVLHRANCGDILLSRANTTELVGACAIVETSKANLYLPDKLWKLHINEGVNEYFFWHLLQTRGVRSRISKASSGSGGSMKNISQKAFLGISVPNFSDETQLRVGNLVVEKRRLRQLLHQKLALLQELQRSLSARAFEGSL